MKSGFVGVQIPPNTPMPQNEYWKVDSFSGGFNSSDAQEDLPPGASPDMEDMEVTLDDRLIRAPGITLMESLTHSPVQMVLHPGPQYASELLFFSPGWLGIKTDSPTQWFAVPEITAGKYGFTNFAGILIFSNGTVGTYSRDLHKHVVKRIDKAPAGQALAVFANRLLIGAVDIEGEREMMGVAWSAASADYSDWTGDGAASQVLIGSMRRSDRIQAFAPLGFDSLAIVCRRSVWLGVPTGDVWQPIRFEPRLEDTGCTHPDTVTPTEFGVLFLADDGVRLFDGNKATIVSEPINAALLPTLEEESYSAVYDPARKRYYLCTPSGVWVFDVPRQRWFKWSSVLDAAVFFPYQPSSETTWGAATGTWGSQTLAWWQLMKFEASGRMMFLKGADLGLEDPQSFTSFGVSLNPRWFDRRGVAENQDTLMTHLGARLTYEATEDADLELWVPNKPDGDYELVKTITIDAGIDIRNTKRKWAPFIHTGRGVGLGIRLLAGSPRIRKASVEFQRTSMPWDMPVVTEAVDFLFVDGFNQTDANSNTGIKLSRWDGIHGFSDLGNGYIEKVGGDDFVSIAFSAALKPLTEMSVAFDVDLNNCTIPAPSGVYDGSVVLCEFTNDEQGAAHVRIALNSARQLLIKKKNSSAPSLFDTLAGPSTATLIASGKQRIEIRAITSATAGVVRVLVDDVPVFNLTNLNTKSPNASQAVIDNVNIGGGAESPSGIGGIGMRFSNVMIPNLVGQPAGFILGKTARVGTRFPIAPGYYTESGGLWSNVDEVVANGDTDYNSFTAVGMKDAYTLGLGDPTISRVLAVLPSVRAQRNGSAFENDTSGALLLVLDGITYESPSTIQIAPFWGSPLSGRYYEYQEPLGGGAGSPRVCWANNPKTTKPWLLKDFNNLQVGYKVRVMRAPVTYIRVTQITLDYVYRISA